ncbi:MAG: family hydrolase [Chloroflexi bacterium]|nr:family hydrolase [Chloroflexota bacterium]
MLIAIDTSTDIASLALARDGRIIAELTWRCGQNHTVELYPALDFLLKKSGLDIRCAQSVVVAIGPGSFNGLRVGVSAAKGLAFSLQIPLVGISTLEAAAYEHAETGWPVCAVQNAGRDEIAVAVYQKKPRQGWTRLSAEHLTTPATLAVELKERTIFCGEFEASTAAQFKRLFKTRAVIPPPAGQLRRAAFLAELGLRRLEDGICDNAASLQPIYLRRPPITERKKP